MPKKEAQRDGRLPVALVAVSKTFDAEEISPGPRRRPAYTDRVQEAQAKMAWTARLFRHRTASRRPAAINKAADAVALFDVIETVDREKIAAALAVEIKKQNKAPKLYVQVNTGLEEQKAGIAPKEAVAFVEGAAARNTASPSRG